jgi:hypothetical protein
MSTVITLPGSSSTTGTTATTMPQVQFVSMPSKLEAGTSLASVRVQLFDAHGRPVSRAGVAVELRVLSGRHHVLSLHGRTNAKGIATFVGKTSLPPGHYTVQAVAKGYHSTTARQLTVEPAGGRLQVQ